MIARARANWLDNVKRISGAILRRKWRLYQTNNNYFTAEVVTAVNNHNKL